MTSGPVAPSGREPERARSAYGLRLRFAGFGVVVGIAFAVWAIVWAAGDGDVNPVVPILAIVFVAGAVTNVVGVLRVWSKVSDGRRRTDRPDGDDAGGP